MSTTSLHTVQPAINSLEGEDRKGFSLLYSYYYLPIYFFVQKFISDEQQAEDITADTFIKLWQYAQATAIQNVKSFLHTTAKNSCLDHLKALRNHQQKEAEIKYLAEQDSRSFQTSDIKAEILSHIYTEIEKLPATSRKVFKLSFVEGMKNAEIATYLKLSEQTVYNQKAIALKHLRLALKDKEWVMVFLMLWFSKN